MARSGPTDDAATPTEMRSLTARSVVASTLLGSDPPRLPVAFLVRTGALFGFAEGTVRTALSRMVTAGDVITDGDGWYALTADLSARRERQERSRAALVSEWSGRWWIGVVAAGPRPPAERAATRAEMERLRLAELRDGVWVRPDNLDTDLRGAANERSRRCHWFLGHPEPGPAGSEVELASQLWDLEGWVEEARRLRRSMHELLGRLEAGDLEALAPGFVLSAAVLRHFVADPLLPRELLPRHWPGAALRRDYDRYDASYRELLADWARREGTADPPLPWSG
jgi:phenylacetic acid degradation operon negative regulatory protein